MAGLVSNSINLNRFPTPLRVAIKEAFESGWTWKKGGSGGLKMRSPKGTQWMHISPGSNIPDEVVKNLRTKMNRALIEEADVDIVAAAADPKEYRVTTTCTVCFTEFLSIEGFAAHQEACHERAAAALAAEEEADKGITPVEVVEPSEGHAEAPEQEPYEPHMSEGFDTIGTKEEDVTENSSARGGYTWNVVKPGLARALYTAMKSRSQHKGEATSTYANVIAGMVEEAGIDFGYIPAMEEAQAKILKISEVLGLDPMAQLEVDTLRADNERLAGQLQTLKELLSDL